MNCSGECFPRTIELPRFLFADRIPCFILQNPLNHANWRRRCHPLMHLSKRFPDKRPICSTNIISQIGIFGSYVRHHREAGAEFMGCAGGERCGQMVGIVAGAGVDWRY